MSLRSSHNSRFLNKVIRLLRNKKVEDVRKIKVKKKNRIFDYLIIGTCMTDSHISSVIDELMLLFEKENVEVIGIEHDGFSGWSVIDLSFAFIHLMIEEKRKFYEIEKLYKYP